VNKKKSHPLIKPITETELAFIQEPDLDFGFGQKEGYTRDGLFLFGPLQDNSAPKIVRYGIIGTSPGIERFQKWSDGIRGYIRRYEPKLNPDAQHHTSFPGFEAVFKAEWPKDPAATIIVNESSLRQALMIINRHEAVKKAVDQYVEPLISFSNKEEALPDLWFVVIPEFVYQLGRPQSKAPKGERKVGEVVITAVKAKRIKTEPTFFQKEDEQEAQIYLYEKHFRRQLKARLLQHKVVTQIIRETTVAPQDFKNEAGYPLRNVEDPATIAWKICTSAYYKAGGKPWRLSHVRPGVCYVGLVYKQTDPESDSPNACCAAQMFLNSGDGLVFRGAAGPWYTPSNKEYHLKPEAARQLMGLVVSEYQRIHGDPPSELFIHGRTKFNDEEWGGFLAAVPAATKLVGVQIKDAKAELKLFRPGNFPIIRGTAFKISGRAAYLWTSGYVPRLNSYLGPETPNPIFVNVQKGECPLDTVLEDVMGLTKINFNTCLFNDRLPVTIRFANAVGEVLIAAPQTEEPKLPFKFYI